ncbi:MAG: membrane protein insertase YidC [Bacteroidetes bacterium]|nr:membrane protein insertase YidC [Bacteroidota bacterium]
MDRNSVIGVVIIFLIIIGSFYWMTPSESERQTQRHYQDSIVKAEQTRQELSMAARKAETTKDTTAVSDTVSKENETNNILRDKFGSFSNSSQGKERFITLQSDLLAITISCKGGGIRKVELTNYKTFDKKPLVLYFSDTSMVGFTFFSNNRALNTRGLYFQPNWPDNKWKNKDTLKVSGNDSVSFSMRLYPDAADSSFDRSKFIEYKYTLKGNDYMTGFFLGFSGMKEVLAGNMDYVNLEWSMHMKQLEKSLTNEKNVTTIYYKYLSDNVDYLSETKYQTKSLKTKVKWISFKQQFFSATLIADGSFGAAEITSYDNKDTNRYLKSLSAAIGFPINLDVKSSQVPMKFYFGPNKYKIFRSYGLDMERQIPLGWSFFLLAWINKYAVIPVFDFLSSFSLNYGIIILILTILLKIVLFPIAYKTYMSSAKMKVLKPEVEEITKKFPKKEDALKKQQATMDLYKRAGINPMSGCFPMLLQLPILIAMFRFFPASIELRQQPFLWATDLSSYDSIFSLPFNIPFYGDHVSLFCLLMTISTLIYTKLSNDMMSSSSQQMPGMKTMMYLMPIMFLGFFNSYSSGLSYYYLLANLITFAQMYIFRKVVNEEKIHATIQENKKKPVKKSGFQKRLEEMANKRGYPAKR